MRTSIARVVSAAFHDQWSVPSAPAAAIAVIMLTVLPTACGGMPGGSGTYRIATANVKSDVIHTARLDGVLAGKAYTDGSACFWIREGDSAMALFWPYRYTAAGNPLTVYDDNAKPVATVGQRVAFGGGRLPDDVHSISGCTGFTQFWGVGVVLTSS